MTTRMQALAAAARQFREYEMHHRAKVEATSPFNDGTQRELAAKIERNREMAELCEGAAGESFQARVDGWMAQCFTPEIAADRVERGDRLLEEVLELLQAGGYDFARIPEVIQYVAGRPVGEIGQEVGGTMVCLSAFCNAYGVDLGAEAEIELERILEPETMARIRAKQAAKPSMSPLPQ